MTSVAGIVRLTGVAVIAAGLAGCAPVRVNSYSERAVDFSRYRTYAWSPTVHGPTGDPRLDDNRFFHERVRADIESGLNRRGYEAAAAGEPDLIVHYHASVTQEIDVATVDAAYCETNDCRPYVYEAGTLLIDLVDARTSRIVWRGWAEGSIEGAIDDQRFMEQRVDEAVDRILERLPNRS